MVKRRNGLLSYTQQKEQRKKTSQTTLRVKQTLLGPDQWQALGVTYPGKQDDLHALVLDS